MLHKQLVVVAEVDVTAVMTEEEETEEKITETEKAEENLAVMNELLAPVDQEKMALLELKTKIRARSL